MCEIPQARGLVPRTLSRIYSIDFCTYTHLGLLKKKKNVVRPMLQFNSLVEKHKFHNNNKYKSLRQMNQIKIRSIR